MCEPHKLFFQEAELSALVTPLFGDRSIVTFWTDSPPTPVRALVASEHGFGLVTKYERVPPRLHALRRSARGRVIWFTGTKATVSVYAECGRRAQRTKPSHDSAHWPTLRRPLRRAGASGARPRGGVSVGSALRCPRFAAPVRRSSAGRPRPAVPASRGSRRRITRLRARSQMAGKSGGESAR